MISVIWFKRDLRLLDHLPLFTATQEKRPILLLYVFEDELLTDAHYSSRHWQFVAESLLDMNANLAEIGHQIQVLKGSVLSILSDINSVWGIHTIYSHQETGIKKTFERDIKVNSFCQKNGIKWVEFQLNGIQRGLKNRRNWLKNWNEQIQKPLTKFPKTVLQSIESVRLPNRQNSLDPFLVTRFQFQKGGPTQARKVVKSFIYERASGYSKHISKPESSREYCSRLSPYIAWGNLSVRQIWKSIEFAKQEKGVQTRFSAFQDRLRWQAHFIQKFESEYEMEFNSVNRGYDLIKKESDEDKLNAWKTGTTGIPMIDASMRCVNETGYLNFRMRAMLVSFLTHHLWQDWRSGVHHLAQQFLDFEPGIHYPQFHMQAGVTGVNTIRMYNPVKQGYDHDPTGEFIKKWVPELSALPFPFFHEPWKLTYLEQLECNFEPGLNYPKPIVDIDSSARFAREILWKNRNTVLTQSENERILQKLVNPGKRHP